MSLLHAARLRPFGLLWAAGTVSSLGDGVHWIALPLLAAELTTDPRMITTVTVAEQLPWLLFGLLAGALADRLDRRRTMWIVDVLRTGIVAGFALAVLAGAVGLPVLLAVAFVLTSLEALHGTAATAYLPSLVPAARLPAANGRIQASGMITDTLLGSPLGAVLFAVAAVAPFALDAGTFAVAALLVAAIPAARHRPATATATGTLRAEVVAGVRFLARHRLLRALCGYSALINLATTVAVALLVLYNRQVLHLGSLGYGLLVATFAVGGAAGALLAGRVAAAVGARRALLGALALAVVSVTGISLAPGAAVAGLAIAAFGAATGVWQVVAVSTRQSLVPGDLLGRVTSAYRIAVLGCGPLGAAAAGLIAHRYGLRAPLELSAGLLLACSAVAPFLLARRDFGSPGPADPRARMHAADQGSVR